MTESFRLATDADRKRIIECIQDLELSKPLRVEIKPYKRSRSSAMNRLLWIWHGQVATHIGETKEDAHESFKHRFCLPILLADDDIGDLNELYQLAARGGKEAELIKHLSTSKMTNKQLTLAMTDYDMAYARDGLVFKRPEDLYREAF